jgi:hypothetical protein
MYNVAREKFLKSGYLYSKKEDSECFEPSFWTFSCQSYVKYEADNDSYTLTLYGAQSQTLGAPLVGGR